jgi:hypothetical protein
VIDPISLMDIQQLFNVLDVDKAEIGVWFVESEVDDEGKQFVQAKIFQNLALWNILDPSGSEFRPAISLK